MRRTVWAAGLALAVVLTLGSGVLAQVTLNYWQGWLAPEHQETELEIVEEFMRQNPDITVKFMHMTTPGEQVKVGLVAGVLGDVFVSSREDFPEWQQIGAFMDLTPFLDRESTFRHEFVPLLLELFKVEGRQYGLPYSANGRALFAYQYERFLEAGVPEPGVETPWSWDEFVEHSQKLVRKDGPQMTQAAFAVNRTPSAVWTWFWANGTEIFNENYTELTVTTRFRETLNFLRSLVFDHGIAPPHGEPVPAVIGSGVGPWSFVPWQRAHEQGDLQMKLMWQPSNASGNRVAMVGGSGLQIGSTTRHPEEAWRLLRYLTSEDVQWRRFLEGYGTSSLQENLIRASRLTSSPIPEPQAIYWDAFSYGNVQPSFPRFRSWSGIWNLYTHQVLIGEISVNEAIEHITRETESLLSAE